MSWSLNGTGPQDNSRGIVGGFSWSRRGDGECISLDFEARGDRLGISPRQLVTLDVNGTRQFYGIAVEVPSPTSGKFGRCHVIGASDLLGRSLSDERSYKGWSIQAIADDILSRRRHPLITGVSVTAGAGNILQDFYMPYQPLTAILDTLAKAIPGQKVVYGVDENGTVFFKPYTPSPSGFAGELPAHNSVVINDVVSRSVVIMSIKAAPKPDLAFEQDLSGLPPKGGRLPVIYKGMAEAEHGRYFAERAFAAPAGIQAFRNYGERVSVAASKGMISDWAVGDGDPRSYAYSSGERAGDNEASASYTLITNPVANPARFVGFRIRYTLGAPEHAANPNASYAPHTAEAGIYYNVPEFAGLFRDPTTPRAVYAWKLQQTQTNTVPEEKTFICPPELWLHGSLSDVRLVVTAELTTDRAPLVTETKDGVTTSKYGPQVKHPGVFKIFELEPLYANTSDLEAIAEANLLLPGGLPRSATINGIVPPSAAGEVFDYVHNSDVLSQTTVSIGQIGGRAIGLGGAVQAAVSKANEKTEQTLLGGVIQ